MITPPSCSFIRVLSLVGVAAANCQTPTLKTRFDQSKGLEASPLWLFSVLQESFSFPVPHGSVSATCSIFGLVAARRVKLSGTSSVQRMRVKAGIGIRRSAEVIELTLFSPHSAYTLYRFLTSCVPPNERMGFLSENAVTV